MASITATTTPIRPAASRKAAPVRSAPILTDSANPMFGNNAVFERLQGRRSRRSSSSLLVWAVPVAVIAGGAILFAGMSGGSHSTTTKTDTVATINSAPAAAVPAPAAPPATAPVINAAPVGAVADAAIPPPAPVRKTITTTTVHKVVAPSGRTTSDTTRVIRTEAPAQAPALSTGLDASATAQPAPLAPATPIAPAAPTGADAGATAATPGAEVQ